MAIDLTIFATDLALIEADIPQSVTIGGTSYPCVAGDVGHDDEMGDLAGYVDQRTVRITVRQSLFTTLPAVGNLVTYDAISWRVVQVEKDPTAAAINLICEETTA